MHVRNECVLRPSPRQPEAGEEEEGASLLNSQAAASGYSAEREEQARRRGLGRAGRAGLLPGPTPRGRG